VEKEEEEEEEEEENDERRMKRIEGVGVFSLIKNFIFHLKYSLFSFYY
jgi:hypothetical protein